MPGFKRSKKKQNKTQWIIEHSRREKKKGEERERELFKSGYSKHLMTFSTKAQTTDWTGKINNQ